MTLTSRISENETTHGDTQTEDERPPGQVLDGAIIEGEVVLLSSGRVGTSRTGLGGDLGFGLSMLDLIHEGRDTHDEQTDGDDRKKLKRKKAKRKEEEALNSFWGKSWGWPFPLGLPWVLRMCRVL